MDLEETLIIVTVDHTHSISGWTDRTADITISQADSGLGDADDNEPLSAVHCTALRQFDSSLDFQIISLSAEGKQMVDYLKHM